MHYTHIHTPIKSFKKESALTSAERIKFRPMFNRSSKKAATQPLESIFPLRRHYNNQHQMCKAVKITLKPDNIG